MLQACRSAARLLAFIPVLILAMAAVSCRHSEILCPGEAGGLVSVRFMWDNAPDADPDGMTLYFFPAGSDGQIWRFDIAGRDGGPVELPTGHYRLLAFNNDLAGVDFTSIDSYYDFTANARRTGQSSVRAPGMLYAATVESVEVTMCGVSYVKPDGCGKDCPKGLVRCYPRQLSTVYTVEVRNVEGTELLRSATATLEGLAPSIRLSDGLPLGSAVSETAALSLLPEEALLTGRTTGFGTAPGGGGLWLTVTAVRTDGKAFARRFDVTDQVVNSRNPLDVLIIIDGLSIPDDDMPPGPGEGDVGIDVGVDGWSEIVVDIVTDA